MSVDPQIRQQVMEILSDPMNLPTELWQYDVQNWIKEAPVFPIGQIFGFAQFAAQTAPTILTSETTASDTYVNLATVGPTLTGLADGNYLLLYKAECSSDTAAKGAAISPSINGATPSDNDLATNISTDVTTITGFTLAALSNGGSNTVTLQYRRSNAGGIATFLRRRLIALKYSNL